MNSIRTKQLSVPSDTDRVSWKIPADKLPEFKAAMEHYDFDTNADFVRVCVNALIRAHKNGDDLSRPLRFQPSFQAHSVAGQEMIEGVKKEIIRARKHS